MRRVLLAHAHVVAGENVLAKIHHGRAFAHATTVPDPEPIHEVGMPIVHARAHPAQEALVNCTERPLGRRMALANGALAAGEDVLPEAEVAALRRRAVLAVHWHERAQNIGNFEALPDEDAHVAIQSLAIMTRREAEAVELVARLALRLAVAGPEPERELARQHGDDLDVLMGRVPPALHAGILEGSNAIAAVFRQEFVDEVLDLHATRWGQVED
mmetsp:Transcript_74484/g.227900  ORF Transcript_74484/g.227900 Transcript_74484/m.227900 type:complete len:215 (+) Transcript_74484:1769-2413(+)